MSSVESMNRQLRMSASGGPTKRGHEFLSRNAGKLYSVTDSNVTIPENIVQLLILEATNDPTLISMAYPPRTWNFSRGHKDSFTAVTFPYDLDTTSLGLTITHRPAELVHSILDEMLKHVNDNGIVQTYFDKNNPLIDACVCVNVLALFYTHGRGVELHRTLEWVYQVLLRREYINGTCYYTTAECFLFFVGRLLSSCDNPDLRVKLKPVFKERVQERIGAKGDALALGMRIVACAVVGIRDPVDMQTLLSLQCEDGGWEIGWVYKLGATKKRIGNRGLATAMALKAIASLPSSLPEPSSTVATSVGSPQLSDTLEVVPSYFVPPKSSTLTSNHPRRRSKPFRPFQREYEEIGEGWYDLWGKGWPRLW